MEGVNGPTTRDADRLLAEAGVLVVPDIAPGRVIRRVRTDRGGGGG
ncbi:hypothetical protein [Microbacterium sp. SA39]|nr:hypothetical protein [Microbacterium sp. SA39]